MENLFNTLNLGLSFFGISSIATIFYFIVNFFARKFNFTPSSVDKVVIALFSINFSILIILIALALYDIKFIFELSTQTGLLTLLYAYLFMNILLMIFEFFQTNSKKFAILMFISFSIINFSIFQLLQQNMLNKHFKNDYQTYLNSKIETLLNSDKEKAIELSQKFIEILDSEKPLSEEQNRIYKKINLTLAHNFIDENQLKMAIEYYQKALNLKVSEISQKIEEKLNIKYYPLQNNDLKNEVYLANDEAIGFFEAKEYKKALPKYKEALKEFMSDNEISGDILNKKYNFDSFKPIIANLRDRESFIKLNFNIAHTYFELKDFNNSYKHFDLALLGAYNNSSTKYLTSICQGISNNKKHIKDINFTTAEAKRIFKYLYQKEREENLTTDLKLIKNQKREIKYSKKDNILESIEIDIFKAQQYVEDRDFENALKFYNNALIVALEHNIHYVIYIHNKMANIYKILDKLEDAVSEYKLVEFYSKDLKSIDRIYSSNQRKYLEKRIVEKMEEEMEEEKVILEIKNSFVKFKELAKFDYKTITFNVKDDSGIKHSLNIYFKSLNKIVKIKNYFLVFESIKFSFIKDEKKINIILPIIIGREKVLGKSIRIIENINELKKINNLLKSSFKNISYIMKNQDITNLMGVKTENVDFNEAEFY